MADRINKILIVIFLTLLIWTWAYMLQEKEANFTAILKVAPTTDPSLLVTFSVPGSRPQTEIPLSPVTFRGAPSRISDLQKQFRKEQLIFYYNPQESGHDEGPFRLDMQEFLQKNDKTQEMALSLISCAPAQVDVNIERLESKTRPVQCYDENGLPRDDAIPEPAIVNVFVRKGFNEPAVVTLTKQQIELARKQSVSVQPYVELGVAGIIRESKEKVLVTIPTEELRRPRTFQTNKPIGIIMSPKLQEQYKVIILNDKKIREFTSVLATEEAFKAYENVAYPFLIEIRESDVLDLSQIPPKKIIYNFPREYVKSGQIELDPSKVSLTAEIAIEPINGGATH